MGGGIVFLGGFNNTPHPGEPYPRERGFRATIRRTGGERGVGDHPGGLWSGGIEEAEAEDVLVHGVGPGPRAAREGSGGAGVGGSGRCGGGCMGER